MTDSTGAATLGRFRLFKGISSEHREQIWSMCERLEVAQGTVLFEQGAEADALYLIEEGELEVVRQDGDHEFTINRAGAGQDVGITALFETGRRTATLRAIQPSVIHRLAFSDLQTSYGHLADDPYAVILKNQLQGHVDYLTSSNDLAVESLQRELVESRKRLSFGAFVAFLIGSVTLYAFLLRIFVGTFLGRFDSTYVTIGVLFGCVVVYLPMVLTSGFPLATYGLNLRNWRSSLSQSLVWTALFLAGVTSLKWVSLHLVPAWKGAPLFSMYGFTRYETLGDALMLMGLYSLFAPVQEFIARGAMQSSLHEFLIGRRANLWAVLLSTLMFSQIHLHLTPGYAIAAFFPSLFWGAMYAKQRSLLGVSVSHILIGVFVAFFLGLPLMEHAGPPGG